MHMCMHERERERECESVFLKYPKTLNFEKVRIESEGRAKIEGGSRGAY